VPAASARALRPRVPDFVAQRLRADAARVVRIAFLCREARPAAGLLLRSAAPVRPGVQVIFNSGSPASFAAEERQIT